MDRLINCIIWERLVPTDSWYVAGDEYESKTPARNKEEDRRSLDQQPLLW